MAHYSSLCISLILQTFSFYPFLSLGLRDMEDMASLWNFQESTEDLKQKLMYATLELESSRMAANEEMKKNKESIKHLVQLLRVAYQERDEARNQLHKVLNKVIPASPPELLAVRPQLQPESPLMKPTKANSSITESNSLSETYNHQSHGSPPVDSFFDTVTSPDPSNITIADSSNMAFVNQTFVPEYNGCVPAGYVSLGAGKMDQASLLIDNLVKGKPLPQKGKLLQTVMEAGPLLQTLLVAGPLPRWRNPPTLQPFQIPPVSIKGCDTPINNQKPPPTMNHPVQKPYNSSPYFEMSCGSSQMFSPSILSFAGGHHNAPCFGNGALLTSGANISNQIPAGKRQRLH